jgi:hypothetical protein
MGNSYVRQSAAQIVNGETVEASPLNAEFNALQNAFSGTAGHSHDGTVGEGPKISLVQSIDGVLPVANGGIGGIHKLDATTGPSVSDDFADGYTVGSLWIDVTNDYVYVCLDSTPGAAIWVTYQEYDDALQSISGLTTVANKMIYTTAADTYATTDLTPFARTILDDLSASAVRTTLGLGTIATQNSNAVAITGGTIAGGTITGGTITGSTISGGTVTGITDISIADGGTGASDAPTARTNLGLGSIATQASSSVSITGGTITGITDLAIVDGGTGASTAAGAKTNLGLDQVNNTSDANKPISTATQTALDLKAPLASPALTGTPTAPTAAAGTNTTQVATTAYVTNAVAIQKGTAVATTSGTSVDFTGIPSGVSRITILFNGVSLSGTEDFLVQIGTSSGIENTGYTSSSGSAVTSTSGFIIRGGNSTRTVRGSMVIRNLTGNVWISDHSLTLGNAADFNGGGSKGTSGTLDRVRITSTGADTFDAGTVNITWEF